MILIVVSWFYTTATFAQNDAYTSGRTHWGIKAGYTAAQLKGRDLSRLSNGGDATSLKSFHVGLTLNSELSTHFWLKHDLLFYRQGGIVSLKDDQGETYKSKLVINTFTLMPISPTFQYKGIQLYAGPYISFVSNASIQRKDENGNLYKDSSFFGTPEQPSNYAQKMDFGAVAGLEYEFPFGLNVGVRFQRGFVNIIENANSIDENGTVTPQTKIRNQSLSFSLGYTFGK